MIEHVMYGCIFIIPKYVPVIMSAMFRHDEETDTILRSQLRQDVLRELRESSFPLTATDIAERLGRDGINSISRTLRRMRDADIIELVNPDQPNDRRYRLTGIGKEALEDATRFRQEQGTYDAGADDDG